MMRLFKFDSLITPSIIKFLFYIGVAASTLGALGVVGSGMSMMHYDAATGFGMIIGGLILILVGIVVSRVMTEMILVIFMIRDELAWQRQQRQNPAAE